MTLDNSQTRERNNPMYNEKQALTLLAIANLFIQVFVKNLDDL